MIKFTVSAYADELVNNCIATQEEISLVTSINGWTIESLDDILYARTGNHDWEQYCYDTNTENVFEDENEED